MQKAFYGLLRGGATKFGGLVLLPCAHGNHDGGRGQEDLAEMYVSCSFYWPFIKCWAAL